MNLIHAILVIINLPFASMAVAHAPDSVASTIRAKTASSADSSVARSAMERIAASIGVESADIQSIAPIPGADGEIAIDVRLGDRGVTLNLHRHSVRSEDFELHASSNDGTSGRVSVPEVLTYRGTIGLDASTRVAASVDGGRITALVRDDDGLLWNIQPLADLVSSQDALLHVVYRAEASTDAGDCGVETAAVAAGGGAGPRGSNTSCEPIVALLALVGDFELYQYHGSSVAATMQAMESIVNAMSYIYEEELGITYHLVRVDIWSGGNAFNVVPDINGEVDHNLLLDTFKNWYNANLPGVNRRFTHMFSGRNFVGSVIGLAVVGVPCNVSSAYGINQMNSNNLGRNAGLVSHEIGHNWGAGHCNGTPGCDIMNSSLGAPSTFGVQATNQIIGPGAPLYSCISPAVNPGTDCNHNGVCDADEIEMGLAQDTNGTGLPDNCERVHNMTQGVYYKSIKTAINEANGGDMIVVAPGTYFEAVDFRGKSLTLKSSGGQHVTAIDVTGIGRSGVALDSGTLDGFTIRGASGGVVYSNAGGGVEVTSGAPLIRQCVVRDNILPGGFLGGGMFIHDGALPTLQTVVFCNNSPQAILGSYTNQGVGFPTTCLPFIACVTSPGDVNGDDSIDGKDVASFIDCFLGGASGFGDCDCADIVPGGGVAASDLQAFIGLLVSQ